MAVGTIFWNCFLHFVTSKFRQNTLDGNVCYVFSVRNESENKEHHVPHTRGGEVAQVCRKKYFSRIDGLEGLPFNPSIRMLL